MILPDDRDADVYHEHSSTQYLALQPVCMLSKYLFTDAPITGILMPSSRNAGGLP